MNPDPRPLVRPHRLPGVPRFYPVPLRAMRNGWTPQRQAHFLGHLAETGSVSAACARVGMSRNSAYELRGRAKAESFVAAWDAALGLPVRKVTTDDLLFLAYQGLIRLRFRGGKYLGSRQEPDNAALMRLLARFDRLAARGDKNASENRRNHRPKGDSAAARPNSPAAGPDRCPSPARGASPPGNPAPRG